MGHSQSLRLAGIRRVFRLLGEIRDLRHDSDAWRKRMIDGLCDLVGARQGVAVGYGGYHPEHHAKVLNAIVGGCPDEGELLFWSDYVKDRQCEDDPTVLKSKPLARRTVALRGVTDLVPDVRESQWFNEVCRPCGIHDTVLAFFRETSLTIQGISLHRQKDDGLFSVREREVIALFNRELYLMWREGLIDSVSRQTSHGNPPISKRQREVLKYLLCGKAESAIAKDLYISPHTVHTHVKAIYKAYSVNSRAQLLAKCLGK